ncbi:MAG: hypothetical protein ACOWWH_01430 [Eubacteriaceae bacterium]
MNNPKVVDSGRLPNAYKGHNNGPMVDEVGNMQELKWTSPQKKMLQFLGLKIASI